MVRNMNVDLRAGMLCLLGADGAGVGKMLEIVGAQWMKQELTLYASDAQKTLVARETMSSKNGHVVTRTGAMKNLRVLASEAATGAVPHPW